MDGKEWGQPLTAAERAYVEAHTPLLIEERDGYTEVWLTDPPAKGIRYRVVEQEWNDDLTVRLIKRAELVDAPSPST